MNANAEQPPKRLGYRILWSLVILIAIPPFYVLSLGPVFGMAKRGWIGQAAADAYVSPARGMVQRFVHPTSVIVRILDAYISLWLP